MREDLEIFVKNNFSFLSRKPNAVFIATIPHTGENGSRHSRVGRCRTLKEEDRRRRNMPRWKPFMIVETYSDYEEPMCSIPLAKQGG
jgi:hypothetical protein